MASGFTAVQTGRTHDRTRPMLQQRQKVLAKASSTHDPKRTSATQNCCAHSRIAAAVASPTYCTDLSLAAPSKWYDRPLLAADDAGDVIGPNGQSVFHFSCVDGSVVDTGDTSLVAADVVQHRFNNVRLNAEIGHARRRRTAQIVETPRHDPATSIQSFLCRIPIIETVRTVTKNTLVRFATRCVDHASLGNVRKCSRRFLVRDAEIIHKGRLSSSLHSMPPTSSRRAPVRINSLTILP